MQDTGSLTIGNECLTATIASRGAELQSVVCGGVERIWCGDPTVWGKRAPLLFPLIGRLRDGWYEHDGRRIEMPKHGFCRERAFECRQVSPTCVRFVTCADEETRAAYPFEFRLTVEFSLEGNMLTKTHTIENTGATPLPFELGGHEAYATRLLLGEHMSDYFVRFEGAERLEMFAIDKAGILDVPKIEVPLENGCLTRTPEQLGIDTVVLENVPGATATLASRTNGYEVTVDFPGFPYLGIWTMAGQDDARYVCIEPWSALPDAHFSSRVLAEKPGVRTVAPGEAVTLSYRMTFR